MRVLLDESVPRAVRHFLPGHEVTTLQRHGWGSKENGELLTLASAEFDVLVTADQNLPSQQNLATFEIAVIVLVAPSNRIEAYEPLAEQLQLAVENPSTGTAQWVTA